MISLALLKQLYDYNYWARDRQLEACGVLTSEQLCRPMNSSFSSLRDTLAHLVGAEWVWHERWRGRTPEGSAYEEFMRPEHLPTLDALRDRWAGVERDIGEYLETLNEERLKNSLTYVNMAGETWSYPLWQTLLHLVNHQSYHRGQVTTLLRQLGAAAVPVDYLVALDTAG